MTNQLWQEAVHDRASIIHDQIAAMRAYARELGMDPDVASRPYRDLLTQLYEEELPLARVLDNSDLVARFEGQVVNVESPPVSVVTYAFDTLRSQVQKVAKAIAGLSDSVGHFPRSLDLGLSGLARGSLVVGVRIQPPGEPEKGSNHSLLGADDQVYQSVIAAVRGLALVTQHIKEERVSDSVREALPDPAERDAILVAAGEIAPSGRRGIDAVSLFSADGKRTESPAAPPLTVLTRKALKQATAHPVHTSRRADFIGIVREIDLDARRFEVRGIDGGKALRCIYPEHYAKEARAWLDQRVKVVGRCEFSPSGAPRLMELDDIATLPDPRSEQMPLPV